MTRLLALLVFLSAPASAQWRSLKISSGTDVNAIQENFRRASIWSNRKLDRFSNDTLYGQPIFKNGIKFGDGTIQNTAIPSTAAFLQSPATFYIVKNTDYLVAPASFTYLNNPNAFLTAPATFYVVKNTDYLVAPASFTYLSNASAFLSAPATFQILTPEEVIPSSATGYYGIYVASANYAPGVVASYGTENIAAGTNAGAARAGLYNAFFGENSGNAVTGDNNAFFGTRTGTSATGSSNALFGAWAGNGLSNGGANVFLGNFAGYADQIGGGNVVVGYQAGMWGTNLIYEVMIGPHAGQSTTGANNIFIGAYSGINNVGGADNTVLGDHTVPTLTSGSRNIVLGNDADVPAASTDDYLNIGNSITGPMTVGSTITFVTAVQATKFLGDGANLTGVIPASATGYYSIYVASANYAANGGTGSSSGGNIWVEQNFYSQTNGSQTQFTLSQTPAANSLRLSKNGVVMVSSADYSLSGQLITMVTAPASSTTLLANYAVVDSSVGITTSSNTWTASQTFTGAVSVSSITIATTNGIAFSNGSIQRVKGVTRSSGTYTGTGSGINIAHGCGATPMMVVVVGQVGSAAGNQVIWIESMGSLNGLQSNDPSNTAPGSTIYADSTNIIVGANMSVGSRAYKWIAFCP